VIQLLLEMSINNKNKIFSNIANTNHNHINNNNNPKTKQKSILDYFNRSANTNTTKSNANQSKRSHDSFDSKLSNKTVRVEDNDISILEELIVSPTAKSNKTKTNDLTLIDENVRTHQIQSLSSDSNEESIEFEYFIDTNQYLEVDFHINEEQDIPPNDNSLEDNESNDSNYMKGSYVYQNFRLMIDSVLKDPQYVHLFDCNDWKIIQSFTSLSGKRKRLFKTTTK